MRISDWSSDVCSSDLPYGRRASASRSLALGIRSCLRTLRKPMVSSGQAMKIDEIVPITMPIICDRAMPSSEPPPYRNNASALRKATTEVMIVRDRTWMNEGVRSSNGYPRRLYRTSVGEGKGDENMENRGGRH